MNLIQLIFVNIKRMLKDPMKVGVMFIMPIAVILFVNFMDSGDTQDYSPYSSLDIAFNIEDEGDLWQMIHDFQPKSMWVYTNDREKAMEALEQNEVAVVYNIPADFTEKINNYEKPIIESYKREEGNTTIPLEIEINNRINELIKEKLLMDKGIISNKEDLSILKTETIFQREEKVNTGDMNLIPMMMIYFIILGASAIGSELIEFKKRNILSRAITTANKPAIILGSLALSLLFFQVGVNIIVLLISKSIIGYDIFSLPIVIVNIILASLFSIALSLAITRVFTNESTATLITTMIGIASMFLSMFAGEANMSIYKDIPMFIQNLGKLTPQYWIYDSLERSSLFPNIFVVVLMIIALFTSGSFRLKDFAKK